MFTYIMTLQVSASYKFTLTYYTGNLIIIVVMCLLYKVERGLVVLALVCLVSLA